MSGLSYNPHLEDLILEGETGEFDLKVILTIAEFNEHIQSITKDNNNNDFNINIDNEYTKIILSKITSLNIFESQGILTETAKIDLINALKSGSFSKIAKLAKNNTCQNVGNNGYRVYAIILNALGLQVSEKYLRELAKNL